MKRTDRKHKPRLKNEDHECEFRSKCGSLGYVGPNKAAKAPFPNLRPSERKIRIRLPLMMLEQIRRLATKKDVPYQSLLKTFLAERIETELERSPKNARSKILRTKSR